MFWITFSILLSLISCSLSMSKKVNPNGRRALLEVKSIVQHLVKSYDNPVHVFHLFILYFIYFMEPEFFLLFHRSRKRWTRETRQVPRSATLTSFYIYTYIYIYTHIYNVLQWLLFRHDPTHQTYVNKAKEQELKDKRWYISSTPLFFRVHEFSYVL